MEDKPMKGSQNHPNDLDKIQKLILYSLCRATSGGKKAHVPKTHFMGRPELRGHRADKAFRELVALNYIIKHPTSGGETFELDARGLEMCRKLREQMKALLCLFYCKVSGLTRVNCKVRDPVLVKISVEEKSLYESKEDLLASLEEKVISPAVAKSNSIRDHSM